MIRRLCIIFIAVAVVQTHRDGSFREANAADRPNIVFMMADDMGMGDTSAYQDFTGNRDDLQIRTPNMDRLAAMGVRFTDAHTSSSRCTPTRYGLLTGRYPWRSRMKHWVLYGSQGDPLIEADRPTLATMLRDAGYSTAMFGKWHVGLRYRRSDGTPAAGWDDADLTQPLYDTPLDHGFDVCKFTSRSHGTSGPIGGTARNTPNQTIGPGHIDGRTAIGATEDGRKLVDDGERAYILTQLGGRHSDHAVAFLDQHLTNAETQQKPFFVYYPSNSNHGPYTPDDEINGVPVAGAARNMAGEPMNVRSDYVYENDVALGRLLDYLEATDDPRRPGEKLISNTIVIFTSDNGAEIKDKFATGPFRSHKGSSYEGGHRVPFLVAWPAGGVGDGDASTPGVTSDALIGLPDMYATFADVIDVPLPDLRNGEKGGEDSVSVLPAWRGEVMTDRPVFYHDHSEAKDDRAVAAMRLDDPVVGEITYQGKWKIFFDAGLLRMGVAKPIELYDLAMDPREETNLLHKPGLAVLTAYLTTTALRHRTIGGHRLDAFAPHKRTACFFGYVSSEELKPLDGGRYSHSIMTGGMMADIGGTAGEGVSLPWPDLPMRIVGVRGDKPLEDAVFTSNERGLGLSGGKVLQVDDSEALLISFDRDVLVESVAIVAGNGVCGGYYQVGDDAPIQIYCVDDDIDDNDQSGVLSDIGVLKKGETLRLDSSPFLGNETPGRWRLGAISVRLLDE